MSISWGKKDRFKFNAVGSLSNWDPRSVAAVYAITCKLDPEKPKAHTVLYFGQVEDMSRDAPELNRQVIEAWTQSGHDIHDLLVFTHEMPLSTSNQRSRIQEQLISEYRPQCNR